MTKNKILIIINLKVVVVFFFFSLMLSNSIISQPTIISRNWKFKTGDSLIWSTPEYKDAHWDNLNVGLWWAHAGYDYSGYAWYRKSLHISSKIKPEVEKKGYLKLNLGQIQDADETYFNGELIGKTGEFNPLQGRWGQNRSYLIKSNLINWDEFNTIAVRVLGAYRNGGMHTGPYFFEPYEITFKDFLKIKSSFVSSDESPEGRNEYKISFTNSSYDKYKGELIIQILDTAKNILHSQKKEVVILSQKDSANRFVFTVNSNMPEIFHITTSFTESHTKDSIVDELTVSSLKNFTIPINAKPFFSVENTVKDVYEPIRFENQMLNGYLGDRLKFNLEKRLLQVDEDELLSGYLKRPGKHNWIGEHMGKYLFAASNTWSYTKNDSLKAQMDRMLFILIQTQKEDGYLGTYLPEHYWTNWDVWSHKYNLIGLLSYYEATGYKPALIAAKRIGDLLYKSFGDNSGQMNIVISGTHVGMASTSVLDPIVDLYRFTGEKKYLDFAEYIVRAYDYEDGPGIVNTLLKKGQVDKVANGKAYEMLSNLVGIIKLYKISGDEKNLTAAKLAWDDVVENRLYVTGTASSYELFKDKHILPADANAHMGEGCVTTYWIKFCYELFKLTGDIKYFEQIEKSIYNHLLGAQNPLTGCVSYYTPLQDKKPFSCGVTCCLSSVPMGVSMVPLFNYGKHNGNPILLFHESSTIYDTAISKTNRLVPFNIVIESDFPFTGKMECTIFPEETTSFPIKIRVPSWAKDYKVTIDSKKYTGEPGELLTVEKKWKKGNKIFIEYDIPWNLISGGKSYPNSIAIQKGPQIFALDQALNSLNIDSVGINVTDKQKINNIRDEQNLPEGWPHKQAYSFYQNQRKLIIVPFSEAGQAGEKINVWINKN